MMQQEFEIFTDSIADKDSLYRLVAKLEVIESQIAGSNVSGTIAKKVPNITPALGAVFNYLQQKGMEPTTSSAQKDYVNQIINYLKNLPVVKMTLAFEPELTFSTRINEVVSAQAGKKVIVELRTDTRIVAGMLLEYAGKFADYSYSEKVDTYIKTKLTNVVASDFEEKITVEVNK